MNRTFLALAAAMVLATGMAAAQKAGARPQSSTRTPKPTGTLAQIMRGIYFPNSNLIFDVQQNDPAAPKTPSAELGKSASSTYASAYTGWETVENAAIALTDGVDLILTA